MKERADKEVFTTLVQQHRGIIGKVCQTYCTHPANRDDLAQEIIYQLWKSYPRFNGTVLFTTWMYRVALNTAISFYRREKAQGTVVPLHESTLDIADNDQRQQEQAVQQLHLFISQFKELDRALMLLYLEEKSYKEIAEVMGITETNVATKLNRIKEKLKQQFLTVNEYNGNK